MLAEEQKWQELYRLMDDRLTRLELQMTQVKKAKSPSAIGNAELLRRYITKFGIDSLLVCFAYFACSLLSFHLNQNNYGFASIFGSSERNKSWLIVFLSKSNKKGQDKESDRGPVSVKVCHLHVQSAAARQWPQASVERTARRRHYHARCQAHAGFDGYAFTGAGASLWRIRAHDAGVFVFFVVFDCFYDFCAIIQFLFPIIQFVVNVFGF